MGGRIDPGIGRDTLTIGRVALTVMRWRIVRAALGGNRVQLPIVGDALERVYAAVCEANT